MVKCGNIIEFMESFAPEHLAESWDNVGLMVGDIDMDVKKVLVSLDIDDSVIDEAIDLKADMIITHHPFIFGNIKNIISTTAVGRRAMKLIKNDIAVYSAHTNLDITQGGTNDVLAKIIGLENIETLLMDNDGMNGLGRVGELKNKMKFIDFAHILKSRIGLLNMTITGNKDKIVKKVALCTGAGSGNEFMSAAQKRKCDVYVTGDLRYHEAQFANNIDLCVADITHYGSEALIVPVLCGYLNDRAEENALDFICVESKVNGQTLNII